MPNLFDSANYPTSEPKEIISGDRLVWKRTDLNVDYDNAAYTLKYAARLEAVGATEIEISASASGDDYVVEVGQSVTAGYTAGKYHWQAYITRNSDSERVTIGYGTWEVKDNRDAATSDPRTHVKIVLDAIEAVIEERATKDQESYSVGGRSLSRTPMADLIVLRDKYKAEYASEKKAEAIKKGDGHSGNIKVRF